MVNTLETSLILEAFLLWLYREGLSLADEDDLITARYALLEIVPKYLEERKNETD